MELSKYIGGKIKFYRELNNMTQDDLAELLKTTRQSISRYENGDRKTNQDVLFDLADIFNTSINNFFPEIKSNSSIETIYNQLNPPRQKIVYTCAEEQLEEQNKHEAVIDMQSFKKEKECKEKEEVGLNGLLTAGHGSINYDKEHYIEVVTVDYVPSDYDLAFKVCGDSMYPTFEDGEIVFIKEIQTVYNGMLAAIEINDDAYIKKIYLDGNRIRLVSLNMELDEDGNRLFPDFYADEKDDIHMIGRVLT